MKPIPSSLELLLVPGHIKLKAITCTKMVVFLVVEYL